MPKLFHTLIPVFIAILGLVGLATPVFADNPLCSNPNIPADISGCTNPKKDVSNVIQDILNSIILVSGIVAVIFVLVGGINYMTSAGDTGKIEKAKKTILYACIGLAVCVLAFAIVNWTIGVINQAETTPAMFISL